jgi:hypothetical protein
MAETRTPVFTHRRNADGSCDSICKACLLTIGHGKPEAELKVIEKNHVCHSSFLAVRGVLKPSQAAGF